MEKMCERAKQYKVQLILAESDLDTNNSQEMKADLSAVSFHRCDLQYTKMNSWDSDQEAKYNTYQPRFSINQYALHWYCIYCTKLFMY